MNNLVMTNIVSEPTMSSREIAELTGKAHGHVLRDIDDMLNRIFETEQARGGFIQKWIDPSNRREFREYQLPQDLTITLVSGYDAAMRHKIVRRWMDLERKEDPAFAVPKSFADALRLAADQQELIQQQAAQLAIAAPKAEFVDRYVESSSGSKGFREVCKVLKAKEPQFRQFLKDGKIMYQLGGAWTAYQNHIEAGRFEVKTGTANEHAYSQAKFTAKGVEWVAGEWAKHQIKGQV